MADQIGMAESRKTLAGLLRKYLSGELPCAPHHLLLNRFLRVASWTVVRYDLLNGGISDVALLRAELARIIADREAQVNDLRRVIQYLDEAEILAFNEPHEESVAPSSSPNFEVDLASDHIHIELSSASRRILPDWFEPDLRISADATWREVYIAFRQARDAQENVIRVHIPRLNVARFRLEDIDRAVQEYALTGWIPEWDSPEREPRSRSIQDFVRIVTDTSRRNEYILNELRVGRTWDETCVEYNQLLTSIDLPHLRFADAKSMQNSVNQRTKSPKRKPN